MSAARTNIERDAHYGALQAVVDSLFDGLEGAEEPAMGASSTVSESGRAAAGSSAAECFGVSDRAASLLGLAALMPDEDDGEDGLAPSGPTVRRLDAVLAAEAADLPEELLGIVRLLPPGDYTRDRLCTQLNSAITGHAWGQVYGTVS